MQNMTTFYQQQNHQLLHQQELLSEPSTPTSLTAPEHKVEYSNSSPDRNNNEEENSFVVNSLMVLKQTQNESQTTTSHTINKSPERFRHQTFYWPG